MNHTPRKLLRYLPVLAILSIVILPFLWITVASLWPNSLLIRAEPTFPLDQLTLSNYQNLQQAASYFVYLSNSVIVAGATTMISLILTILGAYSIYRTRYPGRKLIYRALIVTYVFPGVVLLVPLYQIFSRFGLIDHLLSLIIINVTFTTPFSIWLLRGFFGSIPANIEEAAAIDGAGGMRILFSIILPLTTPGIAAAGIYTFILSWTEYMFASAFILDEARKTLPVGLGAFIAQYYVDWGILAAAAVTTAIPVVILFALIGRYFVQGMIAGSGR